MFVAHYERTMHDAVTVEDRPIEIRRALPGIRGPLPVLPGPRPQFHREPAPVEFMAIPDHARRLIGQVAFWHDLRPEDILGPRCTHPIVAARFDAMAAIYLNCRTPKGRYSLPETGRAMGGRDHTTILHALNKLGIETRQQGQQS